MKEEHILLWAVDKWNTAEVVVHATMLMAVGHTLEVLEELGQVLGATAMNLEQ